MGPAVVLAPGSAAAAASAVLAVAEGRSVGAADGFGAAGAATCAVVAVAGG